MQNILVICGPTSTGKTALALKLAQKFNAEIISADSRQIYKGMDIGTGKDIDKKTIPILLLDIVNPDQPFSVADYQKLAWIVIKDIWKRGKLPILVGGTGLYLKSIIDGIETTGIPQNWQLRKKLNKLSLYDLQNFLKTQNPQKWNLLNYSDQQNPRRLVRAIEITRSQGDTLVASVMQRRNAKVSPCYKSIQIGLTAPNPILFQKIDERVEKRVKQGIVEEIKTLLKKGYSWDLPSLSGLGYRVWRDYFEKRKTLAETIQIWKFQEHDYCRRQKTWFKKDQRIKWFDVSNPEFINSIFKLVENFQKEKNNKPFRL